MLTVNLINYIYIFFELTSWELTRFLPRFGKQSLESQ